MKNSRDTRRTIDEGEPHGRVKSPSSVAFTLTDLLMVIATLAMLAALILPVLPGARLRGKEIQCRNTLKQLGMAERLYLNDNSGNMFPYPGGTWVPMLEPAYGPGTNKLICPLTTVQTPLGIDTAGAYNVAWCKYINGPNGIYNDNGSYTFNGYLYATRLYGDSVPFYKDSNVKYPAQTPVFCDGAWCDAWPSWTNDITPNPLNLQNPWPITPGGTGFQRLEIARHGPNRVNIPPTAYTIGRSFLLPGGINMVFFDGRVESVSLNNLWQQYWHPDWVVHPPK